MTKKTKIARSNLRVWDPVVGNHLNRASKDGSYKPIPGRSVRTFDVFGGAASTDCTIPKTHLWLIVDYSRTLPMQPVTQIAVKRLGAAGTASRSGQMMFPLCRYTETWVDPLQSEKDRTDKTVGRDERLNGNARG